MRGLGPVPFPKSWVLFARQAGRATGGGEGLDTTAAAAAAEGALLPLLFTGFIDVPTRA